MYCVPSTAAEILHCRENEDQVLMAQSPEVSVALCSLLLVTDPKGRKQSVQKIQAEIRRPDIVE